MTDLPLLDFIAKARHTDPRTSHNAAASVTRIRESQAIILDLLAIHGAMTDEEIYSLLPANLMSPSGARTRRSELVDAAKVKDSGLRGKTKSGRSCIIWTLADQ